MPARWPGYRHTGTDVDRRVRHPRFGGPAGRGDRGVEIAQGRMVSHLLSSERAGSHLVHAMLRPMPEALERFDEFRSSGVLDLDLVHLERRGKAGLLEIRKPRRLNAEDDDTLGPTEWATDIALLDPDIEVVVVRGGVVEHPRYAGRRVFGAGLNLTFLYHGRLTFLFFITRDLGYVYKIYRGLSAEKD